jgi:hypothetical protein
VSFVTDARRELADLLTAGGEFTSAPTLDSIKALPAVLVGPSTPWLDGSTGSGPGRVVLYALELLVVVSNAEPIGALAELEACVDSVLMTLPTKWRFDRADQPAPIAARGGELHALSAALQVSLRYSIT